MSVTYCFRVVSVTDNVALSALSSSLLSALLILLSAVDVRVASAVMSSCVWLMLVFASSMSPTRLVIVPFSEISMALPSRLEMFSPPLSATLKNQSPRRICCVISARVTYSSSPLKRAMATSFRQKVIASEVYVAIRLVVSIC